MKDKNCYEFIMSNLNKIDFKDIIIKEHPRQLYDKYILKEETIEEAENPYINIIEVVGTEHHKYKGKTWIQALKELRGLDSNLKKLFCEPEYSEYKKTLAYYKLSAKEKKEIQYSSTEPWNIDLYIFDNYKEYYICDGNHRTIIAKFLNILGLINNKIYITGKLTIKTIDIIKFNNENKVNP